MLPKKRKPTHPGEILSEEFLKPMGIAPMAFAKTLGNHWTEQRLNAFIKGEENLSENMADELASALDTAPDFWNHIQKLRNQWEDQHKRK